MANEIVDPSVLARQHERILQVLAAVRTESRQLDMTFGELSELSSRLEHRLDDLRDDLKITMKTEIAGAVTALETRLNTRFEEFEDRMGALLEAIKAQK